MTKKDYKLIADALIQMRKDGSTNINDVPVYLANALDKDNPRFDREKWFEYLNS